MFRCDAAVIVYLITEYDDEGRPVGQKESHPVTRFRAKTPDIWKDGDELADQAGKPRPVIAQPVGKKEKK